MKSTNEKLESIIKDISKLSYVKAIFIFGSFVKGNATKDSDIDIAVLTNKIDSNKKFEIMGYGSKLFDISVFSRLPLIIQFRVLKEGKLIFSRNQKDIYNLKVEIFKRYLDYSSFINNFYRRIIKNVWFTKNWKDYLWYK